MLDTIETISSEDLEELLSKRKSALDNQQKSAPNHSVPNSSASENSARNGSVENKEENNKVLEPQEPLFSEKIPDKSSAILELPEIDSKPLTDEGWQVLDFKSPAELLCFFNPQLNSGEITLHKWQVDDLELFASIEATSQHPFKYALCAANGSGKDCFIIAGLLMWICLCKKRSLSVTTSASGVQLTGQTENYLRTLGNQINLFYQKVYGVDILKINQRYIRCRLSGSEIRLFATDEEGKSEGWHPLEPGAELVIVVNEAKSVPESIYNGLRRCTGFTRMLLISTPGPPHGFFYKAFNTWKYKRRVTFFDCPHLSKEEFESDKIELGESSFLFRSKWLALFTTIGKQTVISEEALLKCLAAKNNIEWIGKSWPIRVGIDLSLGGDETVIQYVKGNKQLKTTCFRITDATLVADRIDRELSDYGIDKSDVENYYLYMDDGGSGRAIIDILVRRSWNVYRVVNQSRARSKKGVYRNRGAELWYKFQRLITECHVILNADKDEKLYAQIINRHFKQSDGLGGITLMSKAEEKSEGRESPDRADALILAFSDLDIWKILDEQKKSEVVSKRVYLGKTAEEMESNYENLTAKLAANRFAAFKDKVKGSLQMLLKMQNTEVKNTSKLPITYDED